MKSLDELYEQISANEELKKEFMKSFKEGYIGDFLKEHGCDAAPMDVLMYLSGIKENAELLNL